MWPFSLIAGLRRHIEVLRTENAALRDIIQIGADDAAARNADYRKLEAEHQELLQKARARGVFVTEPMQHRPEPPKPAARAPMQVQRPFARTAEPMKQTVDSSRARSDDDTALNAALTAAVIVAVSQPSESSASPSTYEPPSSSSISDSGYSGGGGDAGGGGSSGSFDP